MKVNNTKVRQSYPAKHYQSDDANIANYQQLIIDNPLATLIFNQQSAIEISHIPCHFAIETVNDNKVALDKNLLIAHTSNSHPLVQQLKREKEVLLNLVFHGHDAYISPTDVSKENSRAQMVPTWNYAKVHVTGMASEITDLDQKHLHMMNTTNYFEDILLKQSRCNPWSIEQAPATAIEKMLSAITIFTITIIQLEGRYKLSQNKSSQVRAEIAKQLAVRGKTELGQFMSTV